MQLIIFVRSALRAKKIGGVFLTSASSEKWHPSHACQQIILKIVFIFSNLMPRIHLISFPDCSRTDKLLADFPASASGSLSSVLPNGVINKDIHPFVFGSVRENCPFVARRINVGSSSTSNLSLADQRVTDSRDLEPLPNYPRWEKSRTRVSIGDVINRPSCARTEQPATSSGKFKIQFLWILVPLRTCWQWP